MKWAATGLAAGVLVVFVLAGAIAGVVSAVFGSSDASASALDDIPPHYLALYRDAAVLCPGLDWTILAAIGKIESDHGRSPLPGVDSGLNSYGRAGGPMQFLPSTWRAVRAAHPDVGPDMYNPRHAIPAAAHYLCDNGARHDHDLRAAIYAYNHDDWYVRDVLAQAERHRAAPTPGELGEIRLDWPPQQATVPDPTSGGRITPRTYRLVRALQANRLTGNGIGCFAPRPQNPTSDHPRGRACDVMFDPHNNKASVTEGWRVANWLIAHQSRYGITYLIWQGKYWSADDPRWVTYTSSAYGCPDPGNLTGCHYDHIHVSIA